MKALAVAVVALALAPVVAAKPQAKMMLPHDRNVSTHMRATPGLLAGSSSSHVTGFLYVITYVRVTPHRQLAQTFEFTPTFGGGFPTCYGGNTAEADEYGILAAVDLLSFVDPEHVPGTLRGWWREPGTGCRADPVMLDDGPALWEGTVP